MVFNSGFKGLIRALKGYGYVNCTRKHGSTNIKFRHFKILGGWIHDPLCGFSLSFPVKRLYFVLHVRDTHLAFPIIDDLNSITKLGNQQKCQNY